MVNYIDWDTTNSKEYYHRSESRFQRRQDDDLDKMDYDKQMEEIRKEIEEGANSGTIDKSFYEDYIESEKKYEQQRKENEKKYEQQKIMRRKFG